MEPVLVIGHQALQVTSILADFDLAAVRLSNASELIRYPDTRVMLVSAKAAVEAVGEIPLIRQAGFIGKIIVMSEDAASPMTLAALYYAGCDNYLNVAHTDVLLLPLVKRAEPTKRVRKSQGVLRVGNICIDTEATLVTIADKQVSPTPTEYKILIMLMSRLNMVISREMIMDEAWGHEHVDYRTVDSHFKRLRQRLKKAGVEGFKIQTVYGFGYRGVRA